MLALVSAFTLNAGPVRFEALKIGAKTYKNVTVIGANATDLVRRDFDAAKNAHRLFDLLGGLAS